MTTVHCIQYDNVRLKKKRRGLFKVQLRQRKTLSSHSRNDSSFQINSKWKRTSLTKLGVDTAANLDSDGSLVR